MKSQGRFSETYFESGVPQLGQYASYKPERFYPAFGKMVKELKKHIPCKRILDIGCAKGF